MQTASHRLQFKGLALAVLGAHRTRRPRHRLPKSGHRETAFIHLLLALAPEDLGIDEAQGLVVMLGESMTIIRSGILDAARPMPRAAYMVIIHNLAANAVIDPGHGLGHVTQTWVREGENFELTHLGGPTEWSALGRESGPDSHDSPQAPVIKRSGTPGKVGECSLVCPGILHADVPQKQGFVLGGRPRQVSPANQSWGCSCPFSSPPSPVSVWAELP